MAMQSSAGGSIKTGLSYDGKFNYSIYIPEHVNANTPIFTYTYGAGGIADWYSGYNPSGDYGPFDALLQHGGDSIVLLPIAAWDSDLGKNTNDLIEQVREEYGITNMNVTGSGFSMGGFAGFDIVVENIRRNPNIDPQVVFFIDDYSQKTYYGSHRLLTDEISTLLRDNDTILFMFDPWWKGTDKYQPYVDAGLNVIRVEPDNSNHVAINSNFFRNGCFDYMAGDLLPKEGYTYKYYNRETGTWDIIDYENIATVDDLYDFYGIKFLGARVEKLININDYRIRSDSRVVEGYLNRIANRISDTNYFHNDISTFGGTSTTSVPSQVPTAVRNYFRNVTTLLTNISNFMDVVAKIDPAYQAVDQSLLDMINGDKV